MGPALARWRVVRGASRERGTSFVALLIMIAVLGTAVSVGGGLLGRHFGIHADRSGGSVPILGQGGSAPTVPRAGGRDGLTPSEHAIGNLIAESEREAGRSMPGGSLRSLEVEDERYSPGILIQGTASYRSQVRRDLDRLAQTRTGRAVIAALDANAAILSTNTTIQYGGEGEWAYGEAPALWADGVTAWHETPPDWMSARARVNAAGKVEITQPGYPDSSVVTYNPDPGRWGSPDAKSCIPPVIALHHELGHAMRVGRGERLNLDKGKTPAGDRIVNFEEQVAVGLRDLAHGPQVSENRFRLELRGRGGERFARRPDYTRALCVSRD